MVREGSWSLDESPTPTAAKQAPAAELDDAGEAIQYESYGYAFVWSRGALEVSIAAGLLLLAGIMAAVAGSVQWGEVASDGNEIEIYLSEVHGSMFGFALTLDWSSQQFDDQDGIDQVRIATMLHLIGTITTYVALGLVALSIFLRTATMTALGSIIGAIAVILTITSIIMFPAGAERVWDSFSGGGGSFEGYDLPSDINWGAGSVLAWIGAVAAAIGVVAGFVAIRHPDVS